MLSLPDTLLYWLSLVLGLYSQPLSFLIAVGQGLWAVFSGGGMRFKLTIVGALGAAGLSFVPWLLREREVQQQARTMAAFWFSSGQISGSVLLRELVGDGYWCSIPLLLLAAAALRSTSLSRDAKWLFAGTALAGLAGPIGADALSNYFFAARQLIFAVAPLLALASSGAYELWRRGQRIVAATLLGAFTASAVSKDYKQVTIPKEDWQSAAETISSKLPPNGCFLAAPPDQLDFYAFFRPSLRFQTCTSGRTGEWIVAAISPYATHDQEERLVAGLPSGFVRTQSLASGRIRIAVYRRR
jgi:hypothetical protein